MEIKNLNHLGIIAGIIDELGIVEKINQVLGVDKRENMIKITHGYSRDHRPDLKQFITNLICSNDGDIPLYLKTSSGNDKDSKMFGQISSEYQKQINFETRIVGDSALYTAENLSKMEGIEWITRVPFTVKLAKELARENLTNKLKKKWRKKISKCL